MGWTTTHRAKGITNDEWFKREVLGECHEIVASSTIKFVYYAAVRTIETGEVWGLVCLTHCAPNSHHNFGWKDMTEDMGPGCYDAPAKVLDLLTETTNEYALAWRAECRKQAAKVLEVGQTIRIASGLMFMLSGERINVREFTYQGKAGRNRDVFTATEENDGRKFHVRLPDWKSYAYELVS